VNSQCRSLDRLSNAISWKKLSRIEFAYVKSIKMSRSRVVHSVAYFFCGGETLRCFFDMVVLKIIIKKCRSFSLPSFTPENQDEYSTCVTLILDGGCGVMLR
jgi:hypothetical protein